MPAAQTRVRGRLLSGAVCLLTAFAALAAKAPGDGQTEQPAPGQPVKPPIRQVGPHLYQVGTVTLDAEKRTVRCRGRVNMDRSGPIELLACTAEGKVHESVFVIEAKPLDLQVALLLLDLKDGRNPAVNHQEDDPDRLRPPGAETSIYVEWRAAPAGEGQEPELRRERAERFLYHLQKKAPEDDARWAFLGSRLVGVRLGADLEGSVITTFHDPLAILELALPTANDDVYYYVNEKLCPPVGTPVELVIEAPPLPDKAAAAGDTAAEGHKAD